MVAPAPPVVDAPTPALSVMLRNFSADDPGAGGWAGLLAQARACDAAGVDRVVVADHVVFGEQLDVYGDPKAGGTAGGRQPTGPDGHWLEPLTLLSVIAGQTTRVRLQTGIILASLRRPVVLAKSLSTLDVLSGGRVDLGVGVGWQREEYEAAGLAFEGRGRLLDHTLDVCRTLWTEAVAQHTSDALRFERIHQMPKPAQAGGVPVWVSGRINDNVLRRIVAHGSGWIPWGDDAKDPVRGLDRIRTALIDAGRDPAGFQVCGTLPISSDDDGQVDLDATLAATAPLIDAGITDFRAYVPIPADEADAVAALTPVVEAFRSAVGRPLS
ncbi:MAG: TIGR03619 family F420-dependent LLM class oxidoreductase [Acidimicrobiia bacterium]|nr:TIGR03619 family F420-dependent LLM class oxidoreductase [Acidimicrobiia bacterium]